MHCSTYRIAGKLYILLDSIFANSQNFIQILLGLKFCGFNFCRFLTEQKFPAIGYLIIIICNTCIITYNYNNYYNNKYTCENVV